MSVSCGSDESGSKLTVELSPFSEGLSSVHSGLESVEGFITKSLADQGMSDRLKVKPVLGLTTGYGETYYPSIDDIPLCSDGFKSHTLADGSKYILGQTDQIVSVEKGEWPDRTEAFYFARKALPSTQKHYLDIVSSRKCYAVDNTSTAYPAYRFIIGNENEEYLAVANSSYVFKVENRMFDVETYGDSATIQAYETNSYDAELSTFTINNMSSSGYLINSYFESLPSGVESLQC